MVWYSHLFKNFPQFIVIHTAKLFDIVNKAEIDVFLELPCFFGDPSDHRKRREFQINIYCCFIYNAKDFGCVDHNKLWKILKEMGIPDHLTCLLLTCMQVKKQELELDMEQWTISKLGKECVKAVYYHSPYLTYMQHTL